MGLGTVIGDILTVGGTARRRNRRAREERAAADAAIAANVDLAQDIYGRDLGQSRLEGMNVTVAPNQRMMTEQNRVLGELRNISREGFTATDRAALDEAQRQAMGASRREERAQRDAVLGAAARRGDVRGSNALMASLAAQQGAANAQSDAGSRYATDIALAGRDRARQALSESGAMAGQIRSQQFSEGQANVANQMSQAGGLDQFGQWRAGQQSADAAMLMNARSGQAQNLNASAERREQAFSDGINQAVAVGGAIANAYTGGAAGAATNAVGAAGGAKSASGAGAQSKGATPGALPSAAPSPGGAQAKGRVVAPGAQPGARPGLLGGTMRNAMAPRPNAAPAPRAAMQGGGGAPAAPAGGGMRTSAAGSPGQTNARRRGSLLLGQGGLRGR